MAYSTDGITWTAVDASTIGTLLDIAYGNGRFVAVGSEWPEKDGIRLNYEGRIAYSNLQE